MLCFFVAVYQVRLSRVVVVSIAAVDGGFGSRPAGSFVVASPVPSLASATAVPHVSAAAAVPGLSASLLAAAARAGARWALIVDGWVAVMRHARKVQFCIGFGPAP